MGLSGDVGIGLGTSSPAYKLDVAGVIHATTGIWTDGYFSGRGLAQTSDEREKTDWRRIHLSLHDIVNAPAGSFAWLHAAGRGAGTTAQYWQKYIPEVVSTGKGGKLNMEYGPLAYIVAHRVAEEVDGQGAEVRRLREELDTAKQQIKDLRARLGITS